ncbi:GntR family transcriptional regulator [Cloacibacillus sp.]|uniref:GntR family transcriptional regulator n=1 Tax=Cloacibacillus sp. TaxID=2049023 RepID=UPI0025BAAFD1|nr:GntR family transcriptional regulator [Cloacibacillus sp.]
MLTYGYLLTKIYFGLYSKGRPLPSIHRLSQLLGVSTVTVQGALKMLQRGKYISGSELGRTVIYDQEAKNGLPAGILAREEVLRDIYQGFALILPPIFYDGFRRCDEKDLDRLEKILEKGASFCDEAVTAFLAYLINKLRNPLILDLYHDISLYSYPTHIARCAADIGHWRDNYERLWAVLKEMVSLARREDFTALRSLLERTYFDYDPEYASHPLSDSFNSPYRWGKPRLCNLAAAEIIRSVDNGGYPIGTLLPSAAALSANLGYTLITTRRALSLLNGFGVTKSLNGRGSLVLGADEGRLRVKWHEPSVRKNILSYLQAIQMLAVTGRSVAESVFPHIKAGSFEAAKRDIQEAAASGCHTAATAAIAVCLRLIIGGSPYSSTKEVYGHLRELAVWGYPLSYIPPYPELESFVEMLLRGIEERSGKSFSDGLEGLCRTIFYSSREKMVSVGIAEAGRLELL